jgi:two-component system C4-dicarboxylate transport response regulator DctD
MGESRTSEESSKNPASSVLLVEPDQGLRDVLRELLVRGGFSVDAVSTASEALRRVVTRNYGIIISEAHLPRMNGIELTRHLSKRIHSPVIILTAAWSEQDSETEKAAYLAGAMHFLAKPLSLTALSRLMGEIRNLLSKHEV